MVAPLFLLVPGSIPSTINRTSDQDSWVLWSALINPELLDAKLTMVKFKSCGIAREPGRFQLL